MSPPTHCLRMVICDGIVFNQISLSSQTKEGVVSILQGLRRNGGIEPGQHQPHPALQYDVATVRVVALAAGSASGDLGAVVDAIAEHREQSDGSVFED